MKYESSQIEFDNIDYSKILQKDSRYDSHIYDIIGVFFEFLFREMNLKTITAERLLAEFRDFLIVNYGVMSPVVLSDFGVNTSKDIGNIIRNLKNTRCCRKLKFYVKKNLIENFIWSRN